MKLSEVLNGPGTWCQGVAYQVVPEGQAFHEQWCLLGGLARTMHHGKPEAALEHPQFFLEVKRLVNAIEAVTGQRSLSVSHWNDVPGRTWEEVQAVVEAYDRDKLLNP